VSIPDLINGVFELSGALFIFISINKLYHQKLVRGVSFVHVGFFAVWGIWNIYYYPHLGQWLSFVGGLFVSVTDIVCTIMLIYYSLMEDMDGETG